MVQLEKDIATNPHMDALQRTLPKVFLDDVKFVPDLNDIPPHIRTDTMAYVDDAYDQYFK